ncbi:oxysterol binding protein 1 [Westerdykella ornata]|uniref:Oxysterol binding protein 1 n=1 Tax=Westerdykella ornata TaxID=318751 RepID=A0A6A6JNL7_WESOR|nr:oxysterol binding protein 1 [Westerdykella ornata]KAF2277256.1 oxysterol binding protein 1 [Westerdykella ornata]
MEGHKRSKSSTVKSLINRVSSKTDVTDVNSSEPVAPASSATSVKSHTGSSASKHHRSASRHHRPHLTTTMTNTAPQDGLPPASPAQGPTPTSPLPRAASVEQSVKLFRVFEALRNGDTAAISKAIREQQVPQNEEREGSSLSLPGRSEGTSILHLAIQCAELPVIEFVLSSATPGPDSVVDVNGRDRDGNTPLHLAATLGRVQVVRMLLDQPNVNDSITNYNGQTPLDLARTPEIFQQLQLARSIFIESNVKKIQHLVATQDLEGIEKLLQDPRVKSSLDVNGGDLPTDPAVVDAGGTLLHEAAKRRDVKLAQLLLLNGADPFRRDRKGKLPQDYTKDDRTRAILKRSPAAAAAQRGIQEKTILAGAGSQSATGENSIGAKESREMKGYLKKWTNYTSGYKLRWFVLEDGVLSYYKHQDDTGSACRGAINMKIAKLFMDPQDKLRFEIQGKSSVKYHLKANHQVEAKRWFWALNNAIQWAKDEAREEEKQRSRDQELLKQARIEQLDKSRLSKDNDSLSHASTRLRGGKDLVPSTSLGVPLTSQDAASRPAASINGEPESAYENSVAGNELGRIVSQFGTTTIEGDLDDDEEDGDDASSHELRPQSKDAFNITAQSAKVQLDLLAQVTAALQAEKGKNPTLQISDSLMVQALASYEAAVGNLKGLIGDLLRISRDRDAYWQYRLEREANVRRMWEESMAKVAREHEELENRLGESELKRRKTKRALREALDEYKEEGGKVLEEDEEFTDAEEAMSEIIPGKVESRRSSRALRRKATFADIVAEISESESEEEEEFFDAVGAGEVEVAQMPEVHASKPTGDLFKNRFEVIKTGFKGYEDGPRKRLAMDADNRPKISLWGILKSMIGKDMTKMTLPVSFNEPTSLLQRVAEDMEYAELLDTAAERVDSTERLLYVAAFAASEYASTIGRVAKPFNPLLGETYEYARPDKGYRFFIEQVSHHPPIGAAYAESKNWDYYGESAVKSKFYGKSFDINPLGTWFLRLRPTSEGGKEELYTWKKVTSSVIGIITGNPTVDNYGLMEIKNWTTGEVCQLDFKPRGWKASSAYQVVGKVLDAEGRVRWSVGGRWNDKIYARLTPGFEDAEIEKGGSNKHKHNEENKAFLVWQCHERPTGIPFNLTPFVVTLNALPDALRPHIAPTDTRLRPDQRAMEDGRYDFAATEKNRVEEKQRKTRREREARGEEFVPRWFSKGRCEITGEEYWVFNHEYWRIRNEVSERRARWEEQGLEDIF